MRPAALGICCLCFAACATSGASRSPHGVDGSYRFTVGPDEHEDLTLDQDGSAVWARTSNAWLRETATGSWSTSGDEVTVVLAGFATWRRPTGRLAVRRWEEQVYLVHARDLDWFDRHGPMEEFCFAREGARLVPPPSWTLDAGR